MISKKMAPKKKGCDLFGYLKERAHHVRKETLKIHKIAQETRVASSLSTVEIFTVLYYGKILRFNSRDIKWEGRDRLIISKGHGAISLYPILAELGFFPKRELSKVGSIGSFLGGIPDPIVPGFETVNGSLGHGLGVGCGMALALKAKNNPAKVFVLLGDGELYEGSIWEAVMFAGEHKLNNLILIVDSNKVCMLDFCKNVIDLEPLPEKFEVFKWEAKRVDGHDVVKLYKALANLRDSKGKKPKVLIADTVKAKGIAVLETDPLSHVKTVKPEEIDCLLRDLE